MSNQIQNPNVKNLILFIFLLAVLLSLQAVSFVFSGNDIEAECDWGNIEQSEKNLSKDEYRELLEKCKVYYEQKTDEIEGDIDKTEEEKKSLANKIANLKSKVKSLDYQIYQGNIMVKDLGSQIGDTELSIIQTSVKVDGIEENLTHLLQLRYEQDRVSTIEILLAEASLSDFFDNLMALEALNLKTQELLKNIKDLKNNLENQKASMDIEKNDLENMVIIQTIQKNDSDKQKKEQEYFLQLTELEYQKYLNEKKEAEQNAIRIGNMLFELIEVPEGGIQFEDAVEIAKEISKYTGVRPAFSLAVLWQETKIGKVKGGCYLKNTETGDGVYIKTGNRAPKTMKPSRDVFPFLNIISSLNSAGKLGTDAYNTPVSCCMIQSDGSYFGWGGAMGPAQFIPSTWMLFKDVIEQKTGETPANPWNVRDAFLANSLYLKDLGASSQTFDKEIYSALRYFGCTTAWCRKYYGEPVMRVATCLQDYIDKGSMSASCESLVF